jgi:hypothetical protein
MKAREAERANSRSSRAQEGAGKREALPSFHLLLTGFTNSLPVDSLTFAITLHRHVEHPFPGGQLLLNYLRALLVAGAAGIDALARRSSFGEKHCLFAEHTPTEAHALLGARGGGRSRGGVAGESGAIASAALGAPIVRAGATMAASAKSMRDQRYTGNGEGGLRFRFRHHDVRSVRHANLTQARRKVQVRGGLRGGDSRRG